MTTFPKKGPRLDSSQARPSPRSKPRRIQEEIQGAVEAKARPRGTFLYQARSRPPIEGTPGRTASILDTVRKEGGPTTLNKVRNPTTLGIFFPVRQNDDVPRLDSSRVRPCALWVQSTPRSKPRRIQETIQGRSLGPSYARRSQAP